MFVGTRKLQVTIEIESDLPIPRMLGDDDSLIRSLLTVEHFIGKQLPLSILRDSRGEDQTADEHQNGE